MSIKHIKKVLEHPNGAQFMRCALQVNPHDYAKNFRGIGSAPDPQLHAESIVAKASELGVSVIAITDHNNVESIPTFMNAARDTDITVLPGFETSSSNGVHVLCIYPPNTSQEELSRYLGVLGITDTKPSNALSRWNFEEIIASVKSQGGIAIAAHITNDKGLLTTLNGQACIKAWRSDDLLAVQIPGTVKSLPPRYRRILENTNKDYARQQPVDKRLAVAVVNSCDIVTAKDLEKDAATCWIKMAEPTIEGLRQAFLDPSSRVRLNEPNLARHSELVAIRWKGGFLDGASIHFNPNLNVLIGGRGAGKSTIVESLRCVLDLQPIAEDAQKAHQGIRRHVLRNGTTISLLVRVHAPTVSEYCIERTLPNPPRVVNSEGDVTKLCPSDVLPGIEIYGQHEISELTKHSDKLTQLLARFIDLSETTSHTRESILHDLKASRQELLNLDDKIAGVDEKLENLPKLEERVSKYRQVGLEEKLKEQTNIDVEEETLREAPKKVSPARQALKDLEKVIGEDSVLIPNTSTKNVTAKGLYGKINTAFETLQTDIVEARHLLESALADFDERVKAVKFTWDKRKDKINSEYETILRELQETNLDGEEYRSLSRKLEKLKRLGARADKYNTERIAKADLRRNQLKMWEEHKAEHFRKLDKAARKVSRRLRGTVRVEVVANGNREPLVDLLKRKIGGRLNEAIEILRSRDDLSLTELATDCREGSEKLIDQYGFTGTQAERLANADFAIFLEIEELDLPAITLIKLNTGSADEPCWQNLPDLSTGQKATAVLLLLLLESDSPLIVDQPEDDLDNRFITDGIVPRMRVEKQRRQFIFSTHNANIPVLGDAELIVGLSVNAEAVAQTARARIASEHMGAIDSTEVRRLIENLLEGGKDAFERRRRKYGF